MRDYEEKLIQDQSQSDHLSIRILPIFQIPFMNLIAEFTTIMDSHCVLVDILMIVVVAESAKVGFSVLLYVFEEFYLLNFNSISNDFISSGGFGVEFLL